MLFSIVGSSNTCAIFTCVRSNNAAYLYKRLNNTFITLADGAKGQLSISSCMSRDLISTNGLLYNGFIRLYAARYVRGILLLCSLRCSFHFSNNPAKVMPCPSILYGFALYVAKASRASFLVT